MAKHKKKSSKKDGFVSVEFTEKMKRHRVKVYIPAFFFMVYDKKELMLTLQEAMVSLNVWHFHIEPEVDGDGAYLCMFNKDSFPDVEDDQPTPDATLWLCASTQEWAIKWQQAKVGEILMPSGNLISV